MTATSRSAARLPRACAAFLLAMLGTATLPAQAGDYIFRYGLDPRAVTGSLTINGYTMAVPANSYVNGAHAPSDGTYGGMFFFPTSTLQSTIQGLGPVTLTVQLVHQGTSSSVFYPNTTATIGLSQLYLHLQSATVSGFPVSLGSDCIFGPITLATNGSWNTAYAQAAQSGYTIPPVAPTACAGYGTQISNSVATSNNSVTLAIDL